MYFSKFLCSFLKNFPIALKKSAFIRNFQFFFNFLFFGNFKYSCVLSIQINISCIFLNCMCGFLKNFPIVLKKSAFIRNFRFFFMYFFFFFLSSNHIQYFLYYRFFKSYKKVFQKNIKFRRMHEIFI